MGEEVRRPSSGTMVTRAKHDDGSRRYATDVDQVRRRYRLIAPIYPIFEPIFALPRGGRAEAASRLGLKEGGSVLEVGCGTGRNFPYLEAIVGESGRIIGVDATPQMLAVAERRCRRHHWGNVTLLCADAAGAPLPDSVDAILFSLSYGVIPEIRAVLEHVWTALRPGGRVVVLDARIPPGWRGRLIGPLASFTSRLTVLGDPGRKPWADLRALTPSVSVEDLGHGTYYLCVAVKTSVGQ